MESFTERSYVIPFSEIKRLISYFEWGSAARCAIELLCLSGARLVEINNWNPSNLVGDVLYWKTGKRQRGYRSVRLPEWFIKELQYHLDHHPHPSKHMFNFNEERLSRLLNHIRPKLGGRWVLTRPTQGFLKHEHIYMLKNLRHVWACVDFYRTFTEWGSAELALCATARHMSHSSEKITAQHYCDGLSELELKHYGGKSIGDILHASGQRILPEFF